MYLLGSAFALTLNMLLTRRGLSSVGTSVSKQRIYLETSNMLLSLEWSITLELFDRADMCRYPIASQLAKTMPFYTIPIKSALLGVDLI